MYKSASRLLFFCLILLAIPVAFGGAQGAPEQINDALADLNQRLGRAYTLNDFNWRWSQQNYGDTSLGCPQAGQTYETRPIVAYQFTFTVEGSVYDYRVSADRMLLILCSVTAEGDLATDTPPEGVVDSGVADYSNPLCQQPVGEISYMPTRLTPQIQARVQPGLPNNLRDNPSTGASAIGEIPGGALFTVLQGPVCDDEGFLWYQVDFDGVVGWTAEGRGGDFFLEPLPGLNIPQGLSPISADQFSGMAELSRLQGNLGADLAFAPVIDLQTTAPTLVTVGGVGSEGAWVYDLSALSLGPRTVFGANLLTRVDFGGRSDVALFGSANGAIRLWDIRDGAPLVERAFLQGHDSPVTAVDFSADGTRLASSGGRAFLNVDAADNQFGISMWDVDTVALLDGFRGHSADVLSLTFNSAGPCSTQQGSTAHCAYGTLRITSRSPSATRGSPARAWTDPASTTSPSRRTRACWRRA